jgi:hypothetical protein
MIESPMELHHPIELYELIAEPRVAGLVLSHDMRSICFLTRPHRALLRA